MRCNYCFFEHNEGDVCPKCGYAAGAPADELFYLYPGTVLQGRFVIGQTLGAGGFGIVYKAWDLAANIPVAIKEYYPSGLVTRTPGTGYLRLVAANRAAEFEAGKQRFAAECAGTINIDGLFRDNPSLLHGAASFEDNGTTYLVMEYLEGVTLTKYVETNGPMSVSDSVNMISAVLGAVRDIHSADILHRDISPDNIIIRGDGIVKLFDFGAAKFGKKDRSTNFERVMKPGYSPPEQYEPDGRAGVHTDIYAVGATLYFALTGLTPVEATNRKDNDLLATPQSLNEDIPENVSDAVLRAMAIDHRLRFKDADDFTRALRGDKKVLRPEAELKKRRLRRVISVAASLLVVCAAALIVYTQARERIPTLADASVELWFVLTGDKSYDEQKTEAYEQIIDEFVTIHPGVTIVLRGVPAEEYEREVSGAVARGAPVLFESGGISAGILSDAADLRSVAENVSEDTYFLDRYERLFPSRKQMPTGFTVSCLFINTTLTLTPYEGYGTDDLTDLLASMRSGAERVAVYSGSEAVFTNLFSGFLHVSPEDFFAGEAGAYFADTSALYEVQSKLAGRYRLLRLDTPEIPASFGGMYSVADCGRDELAALTRLLEYMLGENAQDALHIRTQSGLIPLNAAALDTYRNDVYHDYSQFFENTERYVFN